MSLEKWTRSKVNFPLVYKEFEGRVLDENREVKQFRIEDLSEKYVEDVMHNILTGFAKYEPINNCIKLWQDQQAMKDMNYIWRDLLKENLTLVCLSIDNNGNSKLAGFNVLCRGTEQNDDLKVSSETFQKVINLVAYVSQMKNACRELKIDAYLGAMGLYVLPEYRGEGLGLELLKAREPLCKAVGLRATVTVFTSIISQKLAEKAGFKDLDNIPYDDLVKIDKNFYIEGIKNHTKNIRLMYILY